MAKPTITRAVQLKRKVTGREIADAVKDISILIEESYVQELASDHDGDKRWYIGIRGNDLHEDVGVIAELFGNGISSIKLDDSYENIYVVAKEWHGRGQLNYDMVRLTNGIEKVKGELEKNINSTLQDLINEIGRKAQDSGMNANIFHNILLKESSGELLSGCILKDIEIPTWNYFGRPDFSYIGKEEYSKLLPDAKNKVMDLIAARRDYQRLLNVAGEDIKTRPDILIQASEYCAERQIKQRNGLLSLYFSYISGNRKVLRKSVKREFKRAIDGEYNGGYYGSVMEREQDPLPVIITENGKELFFRQFRMEELADFLGEIGHDKKAKKVRERMIEILDSNLWSGYSSSEESQRNLTEILAGKGKPDSYWLMTIAHANELGLYLRTARTLGHEETLHPRAIKSFINYNNSTNPSPGSHHTHETNIDDVLEGLEMIEQENAIITGDQKEQIKQIVLKKYFSDLDNKYEDHRKKARNAYESVWQMFKEEPETADRIAFSMLKHTSEDDKQQIFERLQTHNSRMDAVEHCLNRKVYGEDGFKPESALTYLSSSHFSELDSREQQAVNRLIGEYEHRFMGDEATYLMETLGMRKRLESYSEIKEMLQNSLNIGE